MDDVVKAIEHLQNMAQWMLDAGADEDAVEESLNLIERQLRRLQRGEVSHA